MWWGARWEANLSEGKILRGNAEGRYGHELARQARNRGVEGAVLGQQGGEGRRGVRAGRRFRVKV